MVGRAGAEAPRIFLVSYRLLAADVGRLLEERGARVTFLEPRALSVLRFEQAVREQRPNMLWSINYAPELAFLAARCQLPYVSWTIDPLPVERCRPLAGSPSGQGLAFVHHRGLMARLRQGGLENLRYLPLAAAKRRYEDTLGAPPLEAYRNELSFVGDSLCRDEQALRDAIADLPASQRAEVEGWLAAVYRRAFDDPGFTGLEIGQLPRDLSESASPRENEKLADLADGCLGHFHRRDLVRSLDSRGICVWGDAAWRAWCAHYRGVADHGQQLSLIYRASAINLDVPRLYQRDAITLRAFDVLASGGLLLTDERSELASLMGEELCCTYANVEDLAERVDALRSAPERSRELARRGQEWVLGAHCLEHRVDEILRECAALGFPGTASR